MPTTSGHDPATGVHVVVGAGGAVGRLVVAHLVAGGSRVRVAGGLDGDPPAGRGCCAHRLGDVVLVGGQQDELGPVGGGRC